MAHRWILLWDMSSPERNCIEQGCAPSKGQHKAKNFVRSSCLHAGQFWRTIQPLSSLWHWLWPLCSCYAQILLLPSPVSLTPSQGLITRESPVKLLHAISSSVCFWGSVAKMVLKTRPGKHSINAVTGNSYYSYHRSPIMLSLSCLPQKVCLMV